jgi:hypothetical protein
MAERSIVDVGKFLQKYGLNVGENPAFGGVGGGHSPTGYHPKGLAIDVRDWRPDVAPAFEGGKPIPWKQRTGELKWRAKQLGVFTEVLGPGDKGHDTHVHLALQNPQAMSNEQLEWMATGRWKTPEGKLSAMMPGAQQATQQIQQQQPVGATSSDQESFLKGMLIGMGYGQQPQETTEDKMKRALLSDILKPTESSSQAFLNNFLSSNPFFNNPYLA